MTAVNKHKLQGKIKLLSLKTWQPAAKNMSKYLLGERVHEWALLNRAHMCAPYCWWWTVLISDSIPWIWLLKYDAQHMKLHGPHIDIVLVLSGMEYVNREQLTQRRYQTCRRQATNATRREGLKSYVDMTIYAICQARLELTMCHHTNFVQLLSSRAH